MSSMRNFGRGAGQPSNRLSLFDSACRLVDDARLARASGEYELARARYRNAMKLLSESWSRGSQAKLLEAQEELAALDAIPSTVIPGAQS